MSRLSPGAAAVNHCCALLVSNDAPLVVAWITTLEYLPPSLRSTGVGPAMWVWKRAVLVGQMMAASQLFVPAVPESFHETSTPPGLTANSFCDGTCQKAASGGFTVGPNIGKFPIRSRGCEGSGICEPISSTGNGTS